MYKFYCNLLNLRLYCCVEALDMCIINESTLVPNVNIGGVEYLIRRNEAALITTH